MSKSNGHESNGCCQRRSEENYDADVDVDGCGPIRLNKEPFFIGVAGGTASGKTSVCHKIMCKLGQNVLEHHQRRVVTIAGDNFYKELSPSELERVRKGDWNFDHPDALDYDLMMDTMNKLLRGQIARIPVYDFVTHSRVPNQHSVVYPADVVLLEGILVFYYKHLRDLFDLKIFVDMDADTRLARRIIRDVKERGRDLPSVIQQYTQFVKPAFEEFCLPTKHFSDVIIPRGAENEVAIDLIVQHIREHLASSGNASPNSESPRRLSKDTHAHPLSACELNGKSDAHYKSKEASHLSPPIACAAVNGR